MKVRIQERHMEDSDALREYALTKVEKLEKFFNGIISVEITMDVEKERRIVEIVAHLINKKILKASSQSDDMYTSFDSSLDKVERQLKKYKSKLQDKGRGESIRKTKEFIDEEDLGGEGEGEDQKEIVKTEIYFKKPKSPEEAALQLDAYSQQFLAFLNSKTDEINIIYHRDDGNYGIIVPKNLRG